LEKGKKICGKGKESSPSLPKFEREGGPLCTGGLCIGEEAIVDFGMGNADCGILRS
jgi:hypothetical protein